MCTVTFVPCKDGVLLASNRDEKISRAKAWQPAMHMSADGAGFIYPKDPDGGGTWIAVKENGDAVVLLNGAFEKHTPQPPYSKSRGLILLDIFTSANPLKAFTSLDLKKIEPFTIILFSGRELYEARWNGVKKYISRPDKEKPQIWSSATLYDNHAKQKREQWFREWTVKHAEPTAEDLWAFHNNGGEGDKEIDLIMNRDNTVRTISITLVLVTDANASLHYTDLIHGDSFKKVIARSKNVYPKTTMA